MLHPAQVDVVNEAFTPARDDYTRAVRILDAYERAMSVDRRGAVMLDGEMIDEASRKLALAIVAKSRAVLFARGAPLFARGRPGLGWKRVRWQ